MSSAELQQLISGKRSILEQLQDLTRRQLELIEQGDMTPLFGLLAAKQKLLDQLQQTEKLLDPFREEDPEQRTWATPTAREETRREAERCDQILQEMIQAEQECETTMRVRRQRTESQLQELQTSTQARAAYTTETLPTPRQLDLSSET